MSVRHGLADRVDVLDGYAVASLPEPCAANEPEAIIASVHGTGPGEAWAAAGMDYVTKPIKIEAFSGALARVVQRAADAA